MGEREGEWEKEREREGKRGREGKREGMEGAELTYFPVGMQSSDRSVW